MPCSVRHSAATSCPGAGTNPEASALVRAYTVWPNASNSYFSTRPRYTTCRTRPIIRCLSGLRGESAGATLSRSGRTISEAAGALATCSFHWVGPQIDQLSSVFPTMRTGSSDGP